MVIMLLLNFESSYQFYQVMSSHPMFTWMVLNLVLIIKTENTSVTPYHTGVKICK